VASVSTAPHHLPTTYHLDGWTWNATLLPTNAWADSSHLCQTNHLPHLPSSSTVDCILFGRLVVYGRLRHMTPPRPPRCYACFYPVHAFGHLHFHPLLPTACTHLHTVVDTPTTHARCTTLATTGSVVDGVLWTFVSSLLRLLVTTAHTRTAATPVGHNTLPTLFTLHYWDGLDYTLLRDLPPPIGVVHTILHRTLVDLLPRTHRRTLLRFVTGLTHPHYVGDWRMNRFHFTAIRFHVRLDRSAPRTALPMRLFLPFDVRRSPHYYAFALVGRFKVVRTARLILKLFLFSAAYQPPHRITLTGAFRLPDAAVHLRASAAPTYRLTRV